MCRADERYLTGGDGAHGVVRLCLVLDNGVMFALIHVPVRVLWFAVLVLDADICF